MWEDKEEVSAPSATAVVLQQAPRRTANRAQVLANLGSALVACVYCVRAYLLKGWYIVSYGLAIYQLSLLIGFLTPQAADPWPEV